MFVVFHVLSSVSMEAKKLGFKSLLFLKAIISKSKDNDSSIKIRGVKSIQEAMQLVFFN